MYIKKVLISCQLKQLKHHNKAVMPRIINSTDKNATLYCDFPQEIKVLFEIDHSLIHQNIVSEHLPKVNVNHYILAEIIRCLK